MPDMRNFKIRYFRGGYNPDPRGRSGLHELLQAIVGSPADQRAFAVDGGEIFLADYHRLQGNRFHTAVWLGEMRRLRTLDRVAQGNREGNLEDVRLADGHSISECSYFLTLPQYKTLAFYSSMHSTSWTLFRRYLNNFCQNRAIEIIPIKDPEKERKFQSLRQVRKIVLRVARPDVWAADGPRSLQDFTRACHDFGSAYLTLEFGNGRLRRFLDPRTIPIIGDILRFTDDGQNRDLIDDLTIEGYDNDDGTEKMVIDLLEATLIDNRRYDVNLVRTIAEFKDMAYSQLQLSLERNHRAIQESFHEQP